MKREFLLKGRSVFYTLLIFLSIGMTFALQAESSSQQKADQLYNQAMEILKESLEREEILKAVALLEKAGELAPSREEIWIQLSWKYWLLGDELPKNTREQRKKRLEWFEKGKKAGEKALELNPKSVGGLYWYTVNLASAAEMKGILSSLWLAGTLFGNMSRVDRRDPYYFYGATRRFGSEVFVRVPTWLTSRFGFKPEYIEEDLLYNTGRWSNFFTNYVYLARVYWWEEDKEKALKQLEYVITHNPEAMPEEKAENYRMQRIARKMWKEYTGKEFPER